MRIPGYQVHKVLAETPAATIYQALHEGLNRVVALKVLTPAAAADPGIRARFLEGARLQAGLAHPNIAHVLESGETDDTVYLVSDYLRGGDLETRLGRGVPLRELMGAIGEIARALDYVHGQGIVHGDIKPSNILFREDGAAVLTDFGIARRMTGEASVSAGGTVPGTPEYMSPEQAAGGPLDGRSDLYALAIVLFQMLTGSRPYQGDDPAAVAARHVHDPVPRLPAHLDALQPVLERALAKRPTDRYPNGAAFAAALTAAVASAGTGSSLSTTTLRSDPVSTQEIRAVGAAILASARRPTDPQSTRIRPWKRGWVRVGTYGFVLLLGIWGLTILVEESETAARVFAVVGLTQDPTVQEAWNNARALRRDPNQSLATVVAGYRRVLSLDPNHSRAQSALEAVASDWKADIERALAQGNVTLAANKLAEYLLVFPSDPLLAELTERIRNRRTADTLVNSALAQLRSHGIGDMQAATLAIRSYQEVLRLVPEHPVAQAELDVLAEYYAARAAAAADAGEMDDAIAYLDRASAANSQLPVLAVIRERVRQSAVTDEAIGELLDAAEGYRAADALIDPPGANAAELYQRVLATDPANPVATVGMEAVVAEVVARINAHLTAGERAVAGDLVARAADLGLDQTAVAAARRRIEAEMNRFSRVNRALEEATELLARGLITEPPERNAVQLLAEVESLDPGNQTAAALREQAAARLAAVAQEAYGLGMRNLGRQYLGLALSIVPDHSEWQALQARWNGEN